MDKAKGKQRTRDQDAEGVKDQADKTIGQGRNDFVWVRDDGAVCFGDECVTLKPAPDNTLDMEIKPDRCGAETGSIILDHLIRTAGRGVNIKIAPIQEDKK